jgi:hypothetical protein
MLEVRLVDWIDGITYWRWWGRRWRWRLFKLLALAIEDRKM